MFVSNIYVDNNNQSFENTRKNSSVTAPGDHIFWSFDDARSFETPRINNYSVTAPISLIVLGDESEH